MQRKDGRASKVLGCFGFIVFIYVTGFIVYEVIPWVTRWMASGVHSLPILGDLTVFIGRVLRGGAGPGSSVRPRGGVLALL